MALNYKTKDGSAPQGKPRVYLTGHPKDLPACLDDITHDIFQSQNCAVYYRRDPQTDEEAKDSFYELEQMQLIVIPVTSRFLLEDNQARRLEFPYAMKHHIPVLPLMQEPGLEETFNQICGNLQVLDRHQQDTTALPYEKKLSQYLGSVLIDDDMAEKIRAAFDAYIFLSYRKKDRRYAQQVMHLIHSDPKLYSIAIWYDEFLTPGEDFNAAIEAALEKSQLFALVVTPNIVEAGNYVMTTEYPKAREAGKPILPVELLSTDRGQLDACYQNLPPCASVSEKDAFHETLLKTIRKTALQMRDSSPEHLYFMGLAYLNGIDVEVSRDRALALLTAASNFGLPEAVETLVSVYKHGNGVPADPLTALHFQERLCVLRRKRFEKTADEIDCQDLIFALCDLGDDQLDAGQTVSARKTFLELYDVCRSQADRLPDYPNVTAQNLTESCTRLGNVLRAEGRLDDAVICFEQALTHCQKLCEQSEEVYARMLSAKLCRSLGLTFQKLKKTDQAKCYFTQYLKEVSDLDRQLSNRQTGLLLADSCDCVGGLCADTGDYAGAKTSYEYGLKLRIQIHQHDLSGPEALSDLARSYENLAFVSLAKKDFDTAIRYYNESLDNQFLYWENTHTLQAGLDLADCYRALAEVYLQTGNHEEALDNCREGLDIDQELFKRYKTSTVKARLARDYHILGDIQTLCRWDNAT